jgi:hypothetical protein
LSKQDIKKELGYSPDEGDALALTFAQPVFSPDSGARMQKVYANSDDYEYI